jgi:formyltetrahydrofolate deformylase
MEAGWQVSQCDARRSGQLDALGAGPPCPGGQAGPHSGADRAAYLQCAVMPRAQEFILTLSCRDTTGIVYAASGLLYQGGCNIIDSLQFGDLQGEDAAGLFCQHGHGLNDLLFRWRSGQLEVDIAGIVSNRPDFAALAQNCGLPFHHLPPPTGSDAQTKRARERRVEALIERERVELVAPARLMQVLGAESCRAQKGRAINTHHSFLPRFKGARPYFQAHARGVRRIGTTAHCVTAQLDEGPITERNVQRVDHARRPRASRPSAATSNAWCRRARCTGTWSSACC